MIEILNAQEVGVSLKATVQLTGRLGFSRNTAIKLRLSDCQSILLARDKEANQFYLRCCVEEQDAAFKLFQSGGYFYLNTKGLFDNLEIDYKSQTLIYDLIRDHGADAALGGDAYRMEPRYLPRRQHDGEEEVPPED